MSTSNRIIDVLYSHRASKYLIYQLLQSRARSLGEKIIPHLNREELILDIGSANCTVAELLIKQNLKVYPLDIRDYSIVDTLSPILYDGERMPFRNDQFDTSLILFVLHHTFDPAKLLLEARRVSRRVIVFEDIILSRTHKLLTSAADMLVNLEFYNQPHTNKRDDEWQAIFRELGFRVLHREYKYYGLVFKHALYVLEKEDALLPPQGVFAGRQMSRLFSEGYGIRTRGSAED